MGNFPEIPGYKILDELGKGGMARVYLAYEEKLEREVALKVLLRSLTEEREITGRFLKEAKTAARLRHSNIVAIYNVGQLGDIYYFTMERLGERLKDRIGSKNQPLLQPVDSLQITKQLAVALGYAHDEGFIHRDIKPENILFRKDGTPVLVDFGIAKAVDSTTKSSKTWRSIGTPYYMSPEQISGEDLDNKADIYSLGIVMYEMLTGKVPYDGPNFISISMKHLQEPVPRLPKSLNTYQRLIDCMMAKKREDRIHSGSALADIVDGYLLREETRKDYQSTMKGEPEVLARKSRLLPLFVAFMLLALSVLLIYFLLLAPGNKADLTEEAGTDEPQIKEQTETRPRKNPPGEQAKTPKSDFKNLTRVRMPRCIRKVEPVYPSAAIEAHVQGKVVIDAATDIEGNVVETAVVSGNPLLVEAAVEAVKQWRYNPYLVNNKPISVVFSVTLDFRLELTESPDKDIEK